MIQNKEILYQKLREMAIEELSAVGGTIRGDNIMIVCPFHNDRNPSLGVHIGDKIMPGSFHCWSCNASGSWNKLARQMNLTQVDYGNESKVDENTDPFKYLVRPLQVNNNTSKSRPPPIGLEDLPDDFQWRGVGRPFYKLIGGKYLFEFNQKNDYQMDWLYLPILKNGQYEGHTLCALQPNDRKYLTFSDATKNFLLYDQLRPEETIILVEGHFDAINLVNQGLNAAAILGATNWSDTKRSMILSKLPPKVIVLFDGDEPGYKASREVYVTLANYVETVIIDLPLAAPKMDPGNLNSEWVNYVRNQCR